MSMSGSIPKQLTNDLLTMRLTEGFLDVKLNPRIEMTEIMARELVKTRLEFTEGKAYPMIIDLGTSKISHEARNYMNQEGLEGITAGAFIVSSRFVKYFVSFYARVYKPRLPVQAFLRYEDARLWIREFIV